MPDRKEKEFAQGLYVKTAHPNSPDFVKFRISLKREDLIEWLAKKDGEWINLDVKEGFKEDEHGNKQWYAEVDNWVKPGSEDDESPF